MANSRSSINTEENDVGSIPTFSNSCEEADPWSGLTPAYRDTFSGEVHLAMTDAGAVANMHTFDHLPETWIAQRDDQGRALALHPQIVAGFWRASRFIEIGQVLARPLDA